jgi:hypothetical protein
MDWTCTLHFHRTILFLICAFIIHIRSEDILHSPISTDVREVEIDKAFLVNSSISDISARHGLLVIDSASPDN